MAVQNVAAPRVDTNVSPDSEHFIADSSSADVDLTAISGKPQHAAQKVMFINKDTVGAHPVQFTPEKSVSRTISIPANGILEYNMPVKTITAAGSNTNIQVVAFYWHRGGLQLNR